MFVVKLALPMKKILYILALSVVAFACENDDDSQVNNNNNNSGSTLDSNVTYRVTFNAVWSSSTHPTNFPAGAHFSPFIGLSHPSSTSLFTLGSLASPGIKNMAETGGTSPLNNEILSLVSSGQAGVLITGSGIGTPASTNSVVQINSNTPYVSLVTMIAPSPDWFIGVRDVNLIENGEWVATKTVNAGTYDAGTDSGMNFQSPNSVTSPAEGIHMIDTAPLADSNGDVAPLGSFTFERIN